KELTLPLSLLTIPPSAIVSAPVPPLPTERPPLTVQVEFAPVTITVPCEPAADPIRPPTELTGLVLVLSVPPLAIVSAPVLELQPVTFEAKPPGVPTPVPPLGATMSMIAPPLGRPGGFQLPGVNQSEETAPIQLDCARVDDVAASNAAVHGRRH